MMLLLVALGFMFFAGVAMTINEGLWSNTVLLLCILIAGCASVTAGVPVGMMIFEQAGFSAEYAWYCTFVGMWAVFVVSLLVLRLVAEKASGTRVRFLPVVDKIGGVLMGLFVAAMLTSFAASTLWNGPIRAGEWDQAKASESELNYFSLVRSPFYSVSKPFARSEQVKTFDN